MKLKFHPTAENYPFVQYLSYSVHSIYTPAHASFRPYPSPHVKHSADYPPTYAAPGYTDDNQCCGELADNHHLTCPIPFQFGESTFQEKRIMAAATKFMSRSQSFWRKNFGATLRFFRKLFS